MGPNQLRILEAAADWFCNFCFVKYSGTLGTWAPFITGRRKKPWQSDVRRCSHFISGGGWEVPALWTPGPTVRGTGKSIHRGWATLESETYSCYKLLDRKTSLQVGPGASAMGAPRQGCVSGWGLSLTWHSDQEAAPEAAGEQGQSRS